MRVINVKVLSAQMFEDTVDEISAIRMAFNILISQKYSATSKESVFWRRELYELVDKFGKIESGPVRLACDSVAVGYYVGGWWANVHLDDKYIFMCKYPEGFLSEQSD